MKSYVFAVHAQWADAVVREATFLTRMLTRDCLLALCDDLGIGEKDKLTIFRRATYEANFLTELLPSFGKKFDRSLATGHLLSVEQFASDNDGFPLLLGPYFRKVFDKSGTIRVDACAESVRVIRQVSFYAYKLDLPYSPDKVDRVLTNFVQTESDLSSFLDNESVSPMGNSWDEYTASKANYIAKLTTNWIFSNLSLENLVPKHGPGVTSNCKLTEKWEKQLAVGCPSLLSDLYFFNDRDALDRIERYPVRNHLSFFGYNKPFSRVILVPKDSRGPRLIAAEPVEHQFIQQAIRGRVTDHLSKVERLTRGHINFDDQSVNQRLALESSRSREWATIDLKDASDRVHLGLIHELFGGTSLLAYLLDARSDVTVMPSGRKISQVKYAPMGSALCFPVLSYVVWVLSVSAIVMQNGGDLEKAAEDVYVYGDDLIVKSEVAQCVMDTLHSAGLLVNVDKSFVGARFAESCGCDAFDGTVVTPIRLRSMFSFLFGDGASRDSGIVGLIAHANQLAIKGYSKSSEFCYSLAEEVLGPLPYVTEVSPYLGRICQVEDWEALFGEWNDRCNKGRKSFKAYRLRSETGRGHDSPWAHLYRVYFTLGQRRTVERNVYDLPKTARLQERRVGANAYRLGIYSVPEWVDKISPQ